MIFVISFKEEWVAQMLILVGLVVGAIGGCSIFQTTYGQPLGKTIFHSGVPIRQVLLNEDGSLWVLPSRSTRILRYDQAGNIIGGFDFSTTAGLPEEARISVYDMDMGADGDLYVLVGAVNPVSSEIASYFIRLQNGDPELIELAEPMAAFKGRVDHKGNLYVLGLDEKTLRKAEEKELKGRVPVVHKFTPAGAYLASLVFVDLDAYTEEAYTSTIASPLQHPGNFAVGPNGEVWILWFLFPPPAGGGPLPSKLLNIGFDGTRMNPPTVNRPGCFVDGLFEQVPMSEVRFSWHCSEDATTIVTDQSGRVLYRGYSAGRIFAFNDDVLITSGLGKIPGRYSVLALARK